MSRSDRIAIERSRYVVDGLAAKEAADGILLMSSDHIATWWAIKAGIITTRKTGSVSIPMMSKVMLWPMSRCKEIIGDIQRVVLMHYGQP